MSLKCTGCGDVVDEDHIRFCRRVVGDHLCGSLMLPVDPSVAKAVEVGINPVDETEKEGT
jgi:hypothetical protein